MGKQGPCYHCGTHSTPLWRHGPPEKPVLCNACGSRYRIRGTLANYAPKHAQGKPFAKRSKFTKHKGKIKLQKKYFSSHISYSTASDDSSSHKSSSDPAISYPRTCYNLKQEQDGVEIQGEIKRSNNWECIPSRKRSLVVYRNLTTIEKLQRDLFCILKYEGPSILSENEEDLLIYDANRLQVSYNEIGLGTILLKPNSRD